MERLAKECHMSLYRTSVKEDLNVSGVFQHLAENYVNKVKSYSEPTSQNGHQGSLFQIGASNVSRTRQGPLYITRPPDRTRYVPNSMYTPTHNPMPRPRVNYYSQSSFSPQDYLKNPMFDSLNHRNRYWPNADRTITLRPLTARKINKKIIGGPRNACKVLSWCVTLWINWYKFINL